MNAQIDINLITKEMSLIMTPGLDFDLLLGYIFTVFNYAFYCISRFCRKKYQMLTLDLLAKLSTFVALFFLNSLSGAYSMLVSFVILIVANIKERKNGKWLPIYVAFQVSLVIIMIWKFASISSVLVFATSTISLLSIWWLNPQKMPIAGMATSISSLLYQISIKNWAGLLEIIVICSNILSFSKYRNEKKNKLSLNNRNS